MLLLMSGRSALANNALRSPASRHLRVGVVGAGNMGRGIARSLDRAGHDVAQFDRDPDALRLSIEGRMRAVASVEECCLDAVVVSVSNEAAERSVFAEIFKAKPPLALNLGTTSVSWALELHGKAREAGVAFLDAPVSGGPDGAAKGTLSVMVGGDEAVFQGAGEVLAGFSAYARLMGPSGAGAAAKLVNQLLTASNAQAAAEALALARALKVDFAALLPLLERSWGNSTMLQRTGGILKEADWPSLRTSASAAPLRNFEKDLALIRKAARDAGLARLPSLEVASRTIEEAVPISMDWAAVATGFAPRTYADLLNLAPESLWHDSAMTEAALRAAVRAEIAGGRIECSNLPVVDDDPTGTQSVHGVEVLSDWTSLEGNNQSASCFYLLANTRALDEPAAVARAREIGAALGATGRPCGAVVSRSDSTLRGHFPAEHRALAEGLGWDYSHVTVVAPAFFEGGRLTVRDEHYVMSSPLSRATPDTVVRRADETEFADDKTFGYESSHLPTWLQEKMPGQGAKSCSLTLAMIRGEDGPSRVAETLRNAEPGSFVVVNAMCDRDMLVVALGCLQVEAERNLVYRTAGSFVAARTAMPPKPLLAPRDLAYASTNAGLVVVGSYTAKTTEQLEALKATCSFIELDVDEALAPGYSPARAAADVAAALLEGTKTVVLYTSRKLRHDGRSLAIGDAVNEAVIAIVKSLTAKPAFLIAKGGITSNDVAVRALGMKKASVMGQVAPGVPAWLLGPETTMPGSAYVVFPGNVGSAEELANVVALMESSRSSVAKLVPAMLATARKEGRAVGAFNVYTLEGLLAVEAASRDLNEPAIVQLHPASLAVGGTALLAACRDRADASDGLLAVALDHATDEASIRLALPLVDHVMADGSAMPLDENADWTAAIVAIDPRVSVEAELGRLAGEEDGLSVGFKEAKMTDPAVVAAYLASTRVGALAVTIGNVHGPYANPPDLDWPRLERIRQAAGDTPLVLHGASGLPLADIRRAIELGVSKFNVNTELRLASCEATRAASERGDDVLDTSKASIAAMTEVVKAKMKAFNPHK